MPMVRKMKKETNELFLNLEKRGGILDQIREIIVSKKVISDVKRIN